MEDLFMILTLAALVVFIVGMIKPAAVVFWSKKKTRGMACLYLAAMFVFYVLAGVVAVSTPTKADTTSSSAASSAWEADVLSRFALEPCEFHDF